MRLFLRIASLAWMLGCALLLALPAWAGDCASPDDCSAIPDNGTKAACVGGVIAGYCIYERTRRRKKDDDPEFGEGRADNEEVILDGSGAPSSGDTSTDGKEHTTTDTSPPEKKGPDIMNKPLGGDDIF